MTKNSKIVTGKVTKALFTKRNREGYQNPKNRSREGDQSLKHRKKGKVTKTPNIETGKVTKTLKKRNREGYSSQKPRKGDIAQFEGTGNRKEHLTRRVGGFLIFTYLFNYLAEAKRSEALI